MKMKQHHSASKVSTAERYNHVFSVSIITLILSALSIITIFWKWRNYYAGWRFQSVEHFISSLYLTFLLLSPLLPLFYRKLKASKDSGSNNFSGESSSNFLPWRKLTLLSLSVLFLLLSCALLAPIIAPKDPNAQPDTLALRYLPPLSSVSLIWKDDGTKIYANEIKTGKQNVDYRRGEQWISIPLSELKKDGEDITRGREFFLLGTDKFGRDILSRIIYGSRVSLAVGILAVLIAATIGALIGAVSGFFGKAIDSVLMRMVDIILAFPRLFLILLIVALFKPSLSLTILVLGMTGWMGVSRLVRGQVLSLKETDFVRAAAAMGQNNSRIIWKHLIPNTSALIIVDSTLRIGHIILVEAALSFLGLGVPPPTPSWGSIINDGRDALIDGWWISTFPGIAIALTVISFNLFGDFIRERLTRKGSIL